jgi:hypothetical protein
MAALAKATSSTWSVRAAEVLTILASFQCRLWPSR